MNLRKEYDEIASKILYRINTNLDLNQGDFAFVECYIDKKEYIIGLKLDYVASYMIHIEDTNVLFDKNLKTYHSSIKELFIYDVSEKVIRVKEKLVEINGKKERYISEYALEIEDMRKNDFDKMKLFLSCLAKLERESEQSIYDQIKTRKVLLNHLQNRRKVEMGELIQVISNSAISKETMQSLLEKKNVTLEDSISLNKKVIDFVYKMKFYNEEGIQFSVPLSLIEEFKERIEITESGHQTNVIIKNMFLK